MSKIVLDASAVLAMILKEPGGGRVESALDATSQGTEIEIAISSVNWCEVLTRLQRSPASLTPEELAGILSGVDVVPFERSGAEQAAQLNLLAPSISLGDRACLALASVRKATAWTTDKSWNRVKAGIPIELLR
ncbi:MAG TPA: type II toxin-antitoxin system VapC family toxin [Terracidiphilus sp.]|nr:type II toxin-antitoxin system VapC family toxin [Terracidiphilus sp.]